MAGIVELSLLQRSRRSESFRPGLTSATGFKTRALPVRRRGSCLKSLFNHIQPFGRHVNSQLTSSPCTHFSSFNIPSRHLPFRIPGRLGLCFTERPTVQRAHFVIPSYLNSSYNTSSGGVNLYSAYISRVAAFGDCLFFASFVWL